jgi:hypothetical protein
MGLMSQYTHHHSQFMNMELLRQGYHIKKWPKIFANKEDMMSRDIDASAKALARSFLSASLLMDAWPGHTRMNDMQMKMLLYLYSVSHTYVSYDSMHSVFVGHTNNFKFSSGVRALEAAGYILKDGHGGKREYTITGSGIKQVNEFIQRTLNLNTF